MQEQDEISVAKFVGYYHDELYGDFSSAAEIKAFLEGHKGVIYANKTGSYDAQGLVTHWGMSDANLVLYYKHGQQDETISIPYNS